MNNYNYKRLSINLSDDEYNIICELSNDSGLTTKQIIKVLIRLAGEEKIINKQ